MLLLIYQIDGDTLPPPAGSFEELAETALLLGWPGAFDVNSNSVEQLIRSRLFWEA